MFILSIFNSGGTYGGSSGSGEVYSTEETVIGTWIDGKPLYRKVYTLVLPSTTSVATILQLESNMYVRFIKGYGVDDSVADTNFQVGTNYPTGTFDAWFKPSTTAIEGQVGTQLSGKSAVLALEYTKTTD